MGTHMLQMFWGLVLMSGCTTAKKYTVARVRGERKRGKKRKKPQRSCRHNVGNEGDLDVRREKNSLKRVTSVFSDPDELENSKEAVREAQGTQALSKNCISRESVRPLSRLIRGFRDKYK